MKTIKITVESSNDEEMNDLTDMTCRMSGQDPAKLRDKFKMVDMANPKKLLDLCTHLDLDMEFKNTGKIKLVSVKFVVANNFDISSIQEEEIVKGAKEEEVVEDPEEVTDVGAPTTDNFTSVTEGDLDPNLNEGDESVQASNEEDDSFPF